MKKLVLMRHVESAWNKDNLFAGWEDVDITSKGVEQAKQIGKLLKENGLKFDLAYSSYLKRAIKTLFFVLEEMNRLWIPINKSWKLNERHYGKLQGENREKVLLEYGAEKFLNIRRGYEVTPPPIDEQLAIKAIKDSDVPDYEKCYPRCESLADVQARVVDYWTNYILPNALQGKEIIIVSHNNALRALIKHLEDISDEDISSVELKVAVPIVYEFVKDNDKIKIVNKYHLGS